MVVTSKEISNWYQEMINKIDLKSVLRTLYGYDYNPIRKRIDYYGGMRKTFFVEDLLPTDKPKQLKSGWVVVQQPDANIVEQKNFLLQTLQCSKRIYEV